MIQTRETITLLVAIAALAGCAASPADYAASAAPRTGWFFVGGTYVETKAGPLMERQMYVEFQ